MDFPAAIKKRLADLGMTQRECARLADVTEQKLSAYLGGKRGIHSHTLERVIAAVSMDLRAIGRTSEVARSRRPLRHAED